MAEEYKGVKLPALRKIAEEKEIEGYEDMERPELLDALESLTAPDPDPDPVSEDDESEGKEGEEDEPEAEPEEVEAEPVKEPEEYKSPIITGVSIERYPEGTKAAAMKRHLDLQPKVSILIPLEGDKPGTTFPVTLNGLRLNIIKGMYVSVPKQVAEIIMESQNQTREAIEGPMRTLSHDGLPMRLDGDFSPLSR